MILRLSAPWMSLKSWVLKMVTNFSMQPCKSPVWNTAYALFALGEAGIPRSDARMVKSADWILQKQVRHEGDWKVSEEG